ncbi:hypothetical protein KA517_02895 [Candidatus Gracilibacteria bacterium]|nr:hypothetical protein [Candidatus Gracilibacteria bacterium]
MKKFLSFLLASSLFVPQALAATSSDMDIALYQAKVTSNIRAQASMEGKLIGNLSAGQSIYVRDTKGQWCDVEYRQFEHAYILCSLLEETETEEDTTDYYSSDYSWDEDTTDYYSSDENTDDWYSEEDSMPFSWEPEACDPEIHICSASFNFGIRASLQDVPSTAQDIRLNLHGDGKFNITPDNQQEVQISLNGSADNATGSLVASGELILKRAMYIRINQLLATGEALEALPPELSSMEQYLGKWLTSPDSGDMTSMGGFLSKDDLNMMAEAISSTEFIGSEKNGIRLLNHYRFSSDSMPTTRWGEMLPTTFNGHADFWIDENQFPVAMSLHFEPSSEMQIGTGTIDITLKLNNLNSSTEITEPTDAISILGL